MSLPSFECVFTEAALLPPSLPTIRPTTIPSFQSSSVARYLPQWGRLPQPPGFGLHPFFARSLYVSFSIPASIHFSIESKTSQESVPNASSSLRACQLSSQHMESSHPPPPQGASGSVEILLPQRRWEGVRGSTNSSVEMYVRGHELRSDSISITTVINLSNVNFDAPITFRRSLFVLWTIPSKAPPHQGAFSTLNLQLIPDSSKWSLMLRWLTTDDISLSAALKVLPLSVSTVTGMPLLAVNLLKQRMNAVAFISVTRSRCTTRVTRHVNRQIHIFLGLAEKVSRVYSGAQSQFPYAKLADLPWLAWMGEKGVMVLDKVYTETFDKGHNYTQLAWLVVELQRPSTLSSALQACF